MAHRVSQQKSMNKAILAGFAAGLVGAWVMNEFQSWWSRAGGGQGAQSGGNPSSGRGRPQRSEDANATALAAQSIAAATLDRSLTRDELAIAAPIVHYAFGAAMGALFGRWVEGSRRFPPLAGAAWGAALWAVADEVGVPMLNLSGSPTEYPAEVHLQALAAHLVYGVTTELVQLGVRAAM
jgi:putative membrane protein